MRVYNVLMILFFYTISNICSQSVRSLARITSSIALRISKPVTIIPSRAAVLQRVASQRKISTSVGSYQKQYPKYGTVSSISQQDFNYFAKRNRDNQLLGAAPYLKVMFERDITHDHNETSCETDLFVRLAVQAAKQTGSFKQYGIFPEEWRNHPAIIQPKMFNQHNPINSDFMYKILSLIPWDGNKQAITNYNVLVNERYMTLYISDGIEYWYPGGPRGVLVDLQHNYSQNLKEYEKNQEEYEKYQKGSEKVWSDFEQLKGIKK